jgi:hypothetical protein
LVTGHKEGWSAFPSQNNCQGQVQTPQIPIHDFSALETSREKEIHCKQNSDTTQRYTEPPLQLGSSFFNDDNIKQCLSIRNSCISVS